MRKCWNRQTGTFEVRVSMTCGFKSHLPHHKNDAKSLRFDVVFVLCAHFCTHFVPGRIFAA